MADQETSAKSKPKDGKMTPLMQQYWGIKSEHMDKVLLFRMGDFFEMFHDDAIVAAPIAGIALTQRNKKSSDDTKMCGVPHHSISGPIAKLLAAGHKVAICDQVEDPKLAKGIVKRAVTRILSPGMVYDPETLDQLQANYLCAYDDNHLAFLDTSTGEAFYYVLTSAKDVERIIPMLSPVELVLTPEQKAERLERRSEGGPLLSVFNEEVNVPERFSDHNQVCKRLLGYLSYMQGKGAVESVPSFEARHLRQRMELTPTVLRHLEVFHTYKGEDRGSLFYAINRSKTSSGARLLKNWLSFPLADVKQIEQRLDQVQRWHDQPADLKSLRDLLSSMGDIERRLGKIANPNCNPRDLQALAQSLAAGLAVCLRFEDQKLNIDEVVQGVAAELVAMIEQRIVEDPPLVLKSGGVIRKGVVPALDELITLSEESQQLLFAMEAKERESTGISSLKIRYNNVFGYYIEVTNTHKDKVPDHYKRKQTLTNAERYLTQELQELEEKVLSAKSKRSELEAEIFNDLRVKVLSASVDLMVLAKRWSEIDVYSSLAWLALEFNYRRPSFSAKGAMQLKASRHSVVEQEVEKAFIPNDVKMAPGECILLTGPNMAGKSTIMRQVAVTSILAQVGSFVPAEVAVLPIFDRIFTRIGASDYLAEGLSTFMVEMKETAEMLKAATPYSLVILDEVGRGTSTYDGMSLAQAILEHLVLNISATTLFATHYHELTGLEAQHAKVRNAHMSIREKTGDISFMYTLVDGPANKSYGIQVANLAGLPKTVTKRAAALLKSHEGLIGASSSSGSQMSLLELAVEDDDQGFEAIPAEIEGLLEEIKGAAIGELTPLEALNQIATWQKGLN